MLPKKSTFIKIQRLLAGETEAPPEKEIVKTFIRGLRPDELQTEVRRRAIETLEEVVDETSAIILQFKPMFDVMSSKCPTPTMLCRLIPPPYFTAPFCCHFSPLSLNAFLIGFPIKLSYGDRCDGLITDDYAVKLVRGRLLGGEQL
jgi:hypothetical protein